MCTTCEQEIEGAGKFQSGEVKAEGRQFLSSATFRGCKQGSQTSLQLTLWEWVVMIAMEQEQL